jgi:hypothetical protein
MSSGCSKSIEVNFRRYGDRRINWFYVDPRPVERLR